jgi:hypothetical protein
VRNHGPRGAVLESDKDEWRIERSAWVKKVSTQDSQRAKSGGRWRKVGLVIN